MRGIKVPELTLLFWVIKVLTTGMGETASDWLARTIDPVIAVALALLALAALLVAQLRATRYRPWLYWATVAMVSVFGTMAADVLHVVIGIPYVVSTIAFAVAVAVLLLLWHRVEGTLDIHTITTVRRECFYWTTVCATFALGTAAGDLTANSVGLGYLASGILFTVAFAVPAVAHRWWGLGAVPAFWIAYVLTRPLGASFADWIAVPPARGGLDLGTGTISLVLLIAIAIAVAVHTRQARPSDRADESGRSLR
ncbi:putative integral membrane protein [Pseudonocardia sp. N23]|nr:putative integral membrane protein [Pseudonocardia sp. N23]